MISPSPSTFRHLLTGHDTIECAYYLAPNGRNVLDFGLLEMQKEELRLSKNRKRKTKPIRLGSEEFMLAGHGTSSGYPLLIENDAFSIQFGEFNKPNFFVTYRSIALWHVSALNLHERFLTWAASIGFEPYQPESLSRVDLTFDYQIHQIDFDEDHFISQAQKDSQHRKNGQIQTFRFGSDQVVLRIYNKTDEIQESSQKSWFYDLWETDEHVWRIEWQVRKNVLKFLGIRTFYDLQKRQGDLMRMLVEQHTTLRVPTADSNHSRWPLHPLWQHLTEQAQQMEGLGITQELDFQGLLDDRLARIAISLYGYMKRVAAIQGLQSESEKIPSLPTAIAYLSQHLKKIHDDLSWETDVERRMIEMRLGEW